MTVVLGRPIEEFLGLRPQEVAMLILADLQAQPTHERGKVNAWNYNRRLQQAATIAGAQPSQAFQAGAIALEGWQWLRSNGFLAPHFDQDGCETLTRAGRIADPRLHLAEARGLGILRGAELDDQLRSAVEPLMVRSKYDDAVMAAMRLVEDRTRFAGHYSDSDIGVKMMRSAFGSKGPLHDSKIDPGEATARMELFAGAIGVFKNPASHRIVGNDQAGAVEVILLANTLLRILGRAEKATRRVGRPRKRAKATAV